MALKIACPKCSWEPDGGEYWRCGCGYVWDTFSTAGQCPGCGKQWQQTSCVPEFLGGCRQWSPHLDWYSNLNDLLTEELVAISQTTPKPSNQRPSSEDGPNSATES